MDIPNSVISWIISFLSGRSQKVKLEQDCFSERGAFLSGVPQGTKLGPWLFLIAINNLSIFGDSFDMRKYVDDSAVSEVIVKGNPSEAQLAVDQVLDWSKRNLLQLNCELPISLSRSHDPLPPTTVNGTAINLASKVKLLGMTINSILSWNDHIKEIVKKA